MNVLSAKDAFSAGDDIWFLLPQPTAIFHRINWLLNFQISKALKHQSQELPATVKKIVDQCALKSFDFIENANDSSPLLVAASDFLPTQWIVVVNSEEYSGKNLSVWSKKISNIWASLNVKRARVFLPVGLNAGELEKHWQGIDRHNELSVVVN